jgi:threonyl-tRNA synthetase
MKNNEQLQNKRHSLAHLLAAAVMQLWPDTKRTIGPAIDDGFYFDFEFTQPITEKDLPKLEKQMRKIMPTWKSFERQEVSAEQAKEAYANNPYKIELIEEFAGKGELLTFYKSGEYSDLCRGGHVESMKEIDAQSFKLTHIAGAYWRGDEKNAMLTRIYGLAFDTKEELDAHLAMLEEAKKRDHKKLGPQLDLFFFSDLVGAGLPLWTPKGTLLRNLLDDFVWELRQARGYEKVEIPHITKKDLYETSGHWDKFKDELFRIKTREGHEFAMKPMSCPHHTQIYNHLPRSYRDLPIRYANTTMVYRDEQSGELAGLSRVRCITQDDAHVFCRSSQIGQEINYVWDIVETFYKSVGLDPVPELSFSDPQHQEKYLGTPEIWKAAEQQLMEITKAHGVMAEPKLGEAAFYGPKIDFMATDAIGRKHQVATIQLDVNMPERFDLTCVNEQGEPERIVMVHAAIMGSIERFLAVYIEHTAGIFPVWLSPIQVALLPISEQQIPYTESVEKALRELVPGIRIERDFRAESIGKKIRESSMQKVPYQLVIGGKEEEAKTVAVRLRNGTDLGAISVAELAERIKKEVSEKL